MIQPQYEQINVKTSIECKTQHTKTECKTMLKDSDVKRVLDVFAKAYPISAECLDGQIKYVGKTIFGVIYETTDGDIKRAECGAEFSNAISQDGLAKGQKAKVFLNAERAVIEEQNGIFVVSAIVKASVCVTSNTNKSALAGGENIIVKKKSMPFAKSYGLRQGAYPVQEDFEVNYQISDVLCHDTQVSVDKVQCMVGSIVANGEIVLSLSVLQKNQNKDIIKINKIFPFRLEIECDEAMPSMKAKAEAYEKATKLDISVDEEGGKSVITANFNVGLYGEAFEELDLEITEDAYSSTAEVDVKKEQFSFSNDYGFKLSPIRTVCKGVVSPLPDAPLRIMSTAHETAVITTVSNTENGLTVDGVFTASLFAKDIDGVVKVVKCECPLTFEANANGNENVEIASISVADVKARFVSTEEVEAEVALIVVLKGSKQGNIEVITDVKEIGEKVIESSAISVYIPENGDDLWTVSKRLNACPDDIMALNSDLEFPLTGEERIIIYRQDKR